MWKRISFEKFVKLQQGLVINKTGQLDEAGYWMEWSKITKMGFSSPHSEIRLEERPHERAHISEMSMYFIKEK